MVEKFGDRVKETTDTSGTGTLDLNGAPTGFRAFGDAFTSGDSEISYLIVDDPENPTAYEVGKGTFTSGTPDTFARNTVEVSSNSGNKVSFISGTKTVIASPTAADFAKVFRAGSWALKTATVRSITSDDSQVAGDNGKLIDGDGSGNSPAGLTFTLLAAATAGDGFVQMLKNSGASGDVTIDGNGAETIDGATTLVLGPNEGAVIVCDGTEWQVVADVLPTISESEAEAGTETRRRAWTAERVAQAIAALASSTTLATPVSASGTEIDFTSIPAGTKRIVIGFFGLSTNGSAVPRVQIGDSGGIETSGYQGSYSTNGISTLNMSAGFDLATSHASGSVLHGTITLNLIDSANNVWVMESGLGNSDTAARHEANGAKNLSATLDRVRITTANGTDAFDNGTVNIQYGG